MERDASSTAWAAGTTPHAAGVLERLVASGRWSAARAVRVAERAVLGVKIPVERRHVVCARSQILCHLCYTPRTAQFGHHTPRHTVAWSEGMRGGPRHDRDQEE